MTARIVTGYVPIPGNPRPPEEYHQLARGFWQLDAPVDILGWTVEDCWLWRFIRSLSSPPTWSVADNPTKNTLDYHVVQHEKTAWLSRMSRTCEEDVLIWMDYGIFHQPGVTPEVVNDFLRRVTDDTIAIPGCWDKGPVADHVPCWRFCGSLLICPMEYARLLDRSVREEAGRHIMQTGNVSWEVNTWARMEDRCGLPIRWYPADHNASQFVNYEGIRENATV